MLAEHSISQLSAFVNQKKSENTKIIQNFFDEKNNIAEKYDKRKRKTFAVRDIKIKTVVQINQSSFDFLRKKKNGTHKKRRDT